MILDHLDPAATDAQAFADQAALIDSYGGRDAALKLGAPGATPPPSVS
jgi:choline-sulfatase